MIIFNFIGVGMLILGGLMGFASGYALGFTSEAALMVLSGPFLLVIDLAYRMRTRASAGPEWDVAVQAELEQWWFHPRHGGQLFFLPIWVWAGIWTVLGAYRIITGTA